MNVQSEIEEYSLKKRITKNGRISFLLTPVNSKLALHSTQRLIYLIKNKDEFLYVGETKSSIEKRFTSGFAAYNSFKKNGKARNGYKGYKWIKLLEEQNNLSVFVAIFNNLTDSDDAKEKMESIEGELVFLIRERKGYWPKYQHEIHFHNSAEGLNIAKMIFEKVSETKRCHDGKIKGIDF